MEWIKVGYNSKEWDGKEVGFDKWNWGWAGWYGREEWNVVSPGNFGCTVET